MEPAEEIVTSWLRNQGYFTMNSVKLLHNKEIDILAIHPTTGINLHVEVHVSIRPFGPLRAWSPIEYGKDPLPLRIRYLCENMFIGFLEKDTKELQDRCVEKRVKEILGTDEYERVLIVGVLHKRDQIDELERELEKNGVKLKTIDEVLVDMQADMEEYVYMDEARRYLQIFSKFARKP